jgi:hypothetical protein
MKPRGGLPTYPTYETKEKITNGISLAGLSIPLFVMNLLPTSSVRKDPQIGTRRETHVSR